MKKFLLSSLILLVAPVAWAHSLQGISTTENSVLENFNRIAGRRDHDSPRTTAVAAYRVRDVQPSRKAGESEAQMYIRVVKYALHRDVPITGDDGGYNFGVLSVKTPTDKIGRSLGEYFEEDQELVKAVADALASGLLVLVGDGAGNNTVAAIIAVVDPRNREMVYLVDSNFGSDD